MTWHAIIGCGNTVIAGVVACGKYGGRRRTENASGNFFFVAMGGPLNWPTFYGLLVDWFGLNMGGPIDGPSPITMKSNVDV